MLIHVCSDLHLEMSDFSIANSKNADVLILSGDIMIADVLHDFPAEYDNSTLVSKRHIQAIRFRNFLKCCSENFANVIYIAGNHEFYHGKFYQTLDTLRTECAAFSNIHFLEDDSITIDNAIFVGGTLWTNCNDNDPLTKLDLKTKMNDFHFIKNERKSYRKLSPDDIIVRHRTTLNYISTVAKNAPPDKKVVVVGHHAPSFESVSAEYKDEHTLNGGYASELSTFILDNPNIVLWTHGHMHNVSDYMIGTTRVVCNPRGYHTDNYIQMTHWDPTLLIEV